MQFPQFRRRVEAQLLTQDAGQPPVGLEGVGGPAGRGQSPHQHRDRPLGQRVRRGEVARRGQRLLDRPRPQQRLRPVLRGAAPQLLQPDRGRASEPVGQVPERRAAPQRERVVQEAGRLRGIGVHPRPRGAAPLLEQVRVHPCPAQVEQVAGRAGDHAGTGRAERAPQPRHRHVHRVLHRLRLGLTPDRLRQAVHRHDRAGMQEERGEQGAGTRSPRGDHVARRRARPRADPAP